MNHHERIEGGEIRRITIPFEDVPWWLEDLITSGTSKEEAINMLSHMDLDTMPKRERNEVTIPQNEIEGWSDALTRLGFSKEEVGYIMAYASATPDQKAEFRGERKKIPITGGKSTAQSIPIKFRGEGK